MRKLHIMEFSEGHPKPAEARLAIILLWIGFALGPVGSAFQVDFLLSQAPLGFTMTVALVTYAILALFIHKISVGRNWARISYLVLFSLGLVPAFPLLVTTFERSVLVGLLYVCQWILQITALYLLFSRPGANWFRVRP